MGIKGRRVHIIEEMSSCVISFQRGKLTCFFPLSYDSPANVNNIHAAMANQIIFCFIIYPCIHAKQKKNQLTVLRIELKPFLLELLCMF
jgi:hypothetical protein